MSNTENADQWDEISDQESYKALEEFVYKSWDKGYFHIDMDFERLTKAAHTALAWYDELQRRDHVGLV